MSEPNPTTETMPRAVRRVADALQAAGQPAQIEILDDRVHTAAEAAAALGVEMRQILKSMIFRGSDEDRVVLVLVAGDRQVDLERVASELGEPVARADPNWVRERTGFAVGGVPPLAHATPPRVIVDRPLLDEQVLWAGAGTPHAMFRTSGPALEAMTGGGVADVARR